MINSFIITYFFCAFTFTQAVDEEWKLVADLRNEWMVYDDEEARYIPYVSDLHPHVSVVHFYLSVNEFPGCYLYINSGGESALYIHNKLVDYTPGNGVRRYSLDSLIKCGFHENLFFTLYLEDGRITETNTRIVSRPGTIEKITSGAAFQLEYALHDSYREYLTLSFVIILLSTSIVFSIDKKKFRIYLDFISVINRVPSGDPLLSIRFIARKELINIFNLILITSYVFVLMTYIRNNPGSSESVVINKSIIAWLIIFFILLAGIILKYFLIKVITGLFQINDVENLHFFEYIRLNYIFMLLYFVLFQLGYFIFEIPVNTLTDIVLGAFTVYILLRITILYLKFLNSTVYKKLYLFSYLCATEIVPTLIGVKLLYSAEGVVGF